jgi:hypothetical protein
MNHERNEKLLTGTGPQVLTRFSGSPEMAEICRRGPMAEWLRRGLQIHCPSRKSAKVSNSRWSYAPERPDRQMFQVLTARRIETRSAKTPKIGLARQGESRERAQTQVPQPQSSIW